MGWKEIRAAWKTLGQIGEALTIGPALVGLPFMAALVATGQIAPWLDAALGVWAILVWFILALILAVLLSALTAPLWGMYHLHQIKKDFGPKTRAQVWEWFVTSRDVAELRIDLIAVECGENPVDQE